MHTIEQNEQLKKIHLIVEQVRSLILDDIELELGESPRWPYIRSRLLKYLGDRGLEGRIVETLKQAHL